MITPETKLAVRAAVLSAPQPIKKNVSIIMPQKQVRSEGVVTVEKEPSIEASEEIKQQLQVPTNEMEMVGERRDVPPTLQTIQCEEETEGEQQKPDKTASQNRMWIYCIIAVLIIAIIVVIYKQND